MRLLVVLRAGEVQTKIAFIYKKSFGCIRFQYRMTPEGKGAATAASLVVVTGGSHLHAYIEYNFW
jgi:hypothetical protein